MCIRMKQNYSWEDLGDASAFIMTQTVEAAELRWERDPRRPEAMSHRSLGGGGERIWEGQMTHTDKGLCSHPLHKLKETIRETKKHMA